MSALLFPVLQRLLPETPQEALRALEREIQSETLAAGSVLFREGEGGGDALVLEEGELLVLTTDGDGKIHLLARVTEPGSVVGEQALLAPQGVRNATVLSAVSCVVHWIPGGPFRVLLSKDAAGRDHLDARGLSQARTRLDALSGVLRSLEAGAQLPSLAAASEPPRPLGLSRRRLAAGDVLFSPGDPADAAYAVVSGRVSLRDPSGSSAPMEYGVGEMFGDQSVLERRARRRSAVALRDTELLRIPAEELAGIVGRSSALGASLGLLRGVHDLGGSFGTCFRYSTFVDGQPASTADFALADGRRAVVRHFLDSGTIAASLAGALEGEIDLEFPKVGVEIRLDPGTRAPTGISVPADWPDAGPLLRMLLWGERLEGWQEVALATRGVLLASEGGSSVGRGWVCGCTNLSAAGLARHLQSGVRTVDELSRRTGAGTVCGGCKGRLGSLLGRGDFLLCALDGRELTPEIREFTLTPLGRTLPPCLPGQHVVVEGLMEGSWEGRAYTVTEATPERWRIAVKREPDGVFTSWLFQTEGEQLVRVTPPEGSLIPSPSDPRPLVYVVAGIGVTPALAGVRALYGKRPLSVVYSYRRAEDAAYLAELRGMSAGGGLTLVEVESAREGRVAAARARARIEALLEGSEGIQGIVCGPEGFGPQMQEALGDLPGVQLQFESFSGEALEALRAALRTPGAWKRPDFCPVHPGGREPVREDSDLPPAEQARTFLVHYAAETRGSGTKDAGPEVGPEALQARIDEVEEEIRRTGRWTPTAAEVSHGARQAWRNSVRCVGRMFWPSLTLRDLRDLRHPDDMAEALVEHLKLAFNGGDLRPLASLFSPGEVGEPAPRIWNPQLLRYAGYPGRRGAVVGDPANLTLTERIQALGWQGRGGRFDLLPLVLEVPGFGPRIYELPEEACAEVHLTHPEYRWFESLELRWYAVPAVSDMALDLGGAIFPFVPFNGWYVGTEIAARNLSDANRYDQLPEVARRLGLDLSSDRTLWRDRALIVLNEAVLHSYDQAGVKMSDHHGATQEFLTFCRLEQEAGREVFGEWSWLVPPISGSATPVYQEPFEPVALKPAWVLQPPAW